MKAMSWSITHGIMCPDSTGILASGVGVNSVNRLINYDVQHCISKTLKSGAFLFRLTNKGKTLAGVFYAQR